MKLKERNRKRKGKRVLELIGEVPHVGIGPGESRESKGSDPYVLERLRTRMRYTGVSSVCFSKVFLHFSLSVCCFFSVLCSVFYFILFFHPRFSFFFFPIFFRYDLLNEYIHISDPAHERLEGPTQSLASLIQS